MRLYHFIVGTVALGLASCAAYFSVVGIATFFGTNFVQTAIAAGFLEAGKLVCASAAYRYRNVLQGWTNTMLIFFTVVMMFITSLGIFGFLSQSYQTASSQREISEQKVENVRSQKQTIEDRVQRLKSDRDRLVNTRNELRNLQSEQGWLSERSAERLKQIPQELQDIESRITDSRNRVLKLEERITTLEAENSKSAKLGPIMFIADSVGLDPDRAALYFILIIISVFDPMAVTLVISLSMATDLDEAQVETEEENTEEPLDPDERIQRMQEFANVDAKSSSPEIIEDVGSHQKTRRTMNVKDGEDKTVSFRTPHIPMTYVPPPYEASEKKEQANRYQDSTQDTEREDFRKGVDDLVEVEEEEKSDDEFEQWLENADEDEDPPEFPDVESAFKKPYNDI